MEDADFGGIVQSQLVRSSVGCCDQAHLRSSAGQSRLSTHVLEPITAAIELECCTANGSLMLECALAHQVCDRVHASNLERISVFLFNCKPLF